jgi:hypothetical protein
MLRRGARACALDLRFHLHPDVEASVDLGGTAVSLMLKSRARSGSSGPRARPMPRLEPSVYLEKGRLCRGRHNRSCFRVPRIGRALISVSDKTGLLDLARALAARGSN